MFIKKILSYFGYLTRKESLDLRQELLITKANLKAEQLRVQKERPVLGITIGDTSPSNRTARREYIARVAAFHKDVQKKKLESMICDVRSELECIENTPKMDEILKGTINALWLLHEWGESAINEQIGSQVEALSDDEKQLLEDKLK